MYLVVDLSIGGYACDGSNRLAYDNCFIAKWVSKQALYTRRMNLLIVTYIEAKSAPPTANIKSTR